MATNEIKVFCPATVANVSCGFDVLGVALDSVGDEMVVRKVPQKGIIGTLSVALKMKYPNESPEHLDQQVREIWESRDRNRFN